MLFVYIFTVIIVILILGKIKTHVRPIEIKKVEKDGLSFFSTARHRIKVDECKIFTIGDIVYIKNGYKVVYIKNITNLNRKNEYLYFDSRGDVKIYFDLSQYYKYFALRLELNGIDCKKLRLFAINDILDNTFQLEKCEYVQKYIKLINLLNIKINNNNLKISINKYKIDFTVMYKLNNKIKIIKIIN